MCCVCGRVDGLIRTRCEHTTLSRSKRPATGRTCPTCWVDCDECRVQQCGLCHASGPCTKVHVRCPVDCEHQAVVWPTEHCSVCVTGPYHSQCLTGVRDGLPVCMLCCEQHDEAPQEEETCTVVDIEVEASRLQSEARTASTPTVRVEFGPDATPGEFLTYCVLFTQRDCSLLTHDCMHTMYYLYILCVRIILYILI